MSLSVGQPLEIYMKKLLQIQKSMFLKKKKIKNKKIYFKLYAKIQILKFFHMDIIEVDRTKRPLTFLFVALLTCGKR